MIQAAKSMSRSEQAGYFLRQELKRKGLSQEKFAEIMYVDVRTVGRWLKNGIPNVDTIQQISERLGLCFGDIFA